MKSVLFVSLLFYSVCASGQDKQQIVGTWVITSAELSDQLTLEEAARRQFEPFIAAFEGSLLTFRKNGKSTFDTKVPQFNFEDLLWTYDGGYINLRESSRSAIRYQFAVAEDEEFMKLFIMETPFVLTMMRNEKKK